MSMSDTPALPFPFDPARMAAELRDCEATRLLLYDDATGTPLRPGDRIAGHPTIGVGRALDIRGITPSEASMLLQSDLALYALELRTLPWFAALDPVRRRAIVNMRHQLGMDGLLGFPILIGRLRVHDYEGAAAAGLASRWHNQTPRRCETVMQQLRSGTSWLA